MLLRLLRHPMFVRLASAAALGPAVVWVLWYGKASFAALIAASAMLCIWEWCKLTILRHHGPVVRVMGVALLLTLVLGILQLWVWAWAALALAAVVSALWAGMMRAYPARALVGMIYVGAPHLLALWMHSLPHGHVLVVALVLIVWACDGGAYFSGKLLGGPRMAPSISPNKTWAGAIGGTIAGLAAAWAASAVYDRPLEIMIVGGVLICITAQLGDLFESALKRQFKAKDSGDLIPGHGGLLDRIDGLMMALIVVGLVVMMWPQLWGAS